jgi:hypothetical protein
MTGPEHYRKAEKLLTESATSGPSISERDTWQQRQALAPISTQEDRRNFHASS